MKKNVFIISFLRNTKCQMTIENHLEKFSLVNQKNSNQAEVTFSPKIPLLYIFEKYCQTSTFTIQWEIG